MGAEEERKKEKGGKKREYRKALRVSRFQDGGNLLQSKGEGSGGRGGGKRKKGKKGVEKGCTKRKRGLKSPSFMSFWKHP